VPLGVSINTIRIHTTLAILFFLWQVVISFEVSPFLHNGFNQTKEPTPKEFANKQTLIE